MVRELKVVKLEFDVVCEGEALMSTVQERQDHPGSVAVAAVQRARDVLVHDGQQLVIWVSVQELALVQVPLEREPLRVMAHHHRMYRGTKSRACVPHWSGYPCCVKHVEYCRER